MTQRNSEQSDFAARALASTATLIGCVSVFVLLPIARGAPLESLYSGAPGWGLLLPLGLGLPWIAWSYGWFHWSTVTPRGPLEKGRIYRVVVLSALTIVCALPAIPASLVVVTGIEAVQDID